MGFVIQDPERMLPESALNPELWDLVNRDHQKSTNTM